ncbi:MAG: cation transporter [Prevotella sp.]|nr:cation transporter [Prevotella sp.]
MSTTNNKEKKYVVAGASTNLLLLVMKFYVAICAHSAALMADAIHSLFNLFGDGLAVAFMALNKRAKNDSHDYGYGRYATVMCLAISLVLFVAAFFWGFKCAGDFILFMQGVFPVNVRFAAIIAAVVSVFVLLALSRFAVRHAQQLNSDVLTRAAHRYDFDMWSSLGTFIVLLPVVIVAGKWKVLDVLAAMVICLFVMLEACRLFRNALDELLDKSLPEDTEADLAKLAAGVDGVEAVTGVLTRKVGGQMAIELNVTMSGEDSLDVIHQRVKEIKQLINDKYDQVTHLAVHVEPSNQ